MTRYSVRIQGGPGRPFITHAKNHKHAARLYLTYSSVARQRQAEDIRPPVLQVLLMGTACTRFYRCRGGRIYQAMRHRGASYA